MTNSNLEEDDIVNILEIVFGMNDKTINESEVIKRTFSNKQLNERFKSAAGILKPKIEAHGYNGQIIGMEKAKEIYNEGK